MNKKCLKFGVIFGMFFIVVLSSFCPVISGVTTVSSGGDYSVFLDNLLFYARSDSPYVNDSIILDKYLTYMDYFGDCVSSAEVVDVEDNFLEKSNYNVEKCSSQMSSVGPMDSAWPMFCHDTRHTSQSPYSTEFNPGTEIWRFEVDGLIEDTPVIADNGIIYFGGGYGHLPYYLIALYPNGSLYWRYKTDGLIWGSSPAIDDDGTVYVGSWDDYFYAIYPNGTLKWRFLA